MSDEAGAVDYLVLKLAAANISQDQRDAWQKQGVSMSDGSYPIPNVEYLKKAIQSIGRAPDDKRDAVKAHIKKRAKALDAENLIPEGW